VGRWSSTLLHGGYFGTHGPSQYKMKKAMRACLWAGERQGLMFTVSDENEDPCVIVLI